MRVEDINRIAVIGAGLMGHGIAQEFAMNNYHVRMYEPWQDKLDQAELNIHNNLQFLKDEQKVLFLGQQTISLILRNEGFFGLSRKTAIFAGVLLNF